MKTGKKIGIIIGLVLDALVTIFLFIISILMIVKSTEGLSPSEIANLPNNCIINWLIKPQNLWCYLVFFVIPLFLLLIANIVFLVLYVKKSGKKKEVTVDDLDESQINALKQELLDDLVKNKTKSKEDKEEK